MMRLWRDVVRRGCMCRVMELNMCQVTCRCHSAGVAQVAEIRFKVVVVRQRPWTAQQNQMSLSMASHVKGIRRGSPSVRPRMQADHRSACLHAAIAHADGSSKRLIVRVGNCCPSGIVSTKHPFSRASTMTIRAPNRA